MVFHLAQIVRLLPIRQPGQLELEVRLSVADEAELEGAVRRGDAPHGLEAERFVIEAKGALQIEDVEIEMIECEHAFTPVLSVLCEIRLPFADSKIIQ